MPFLALPVTMQLFGNTLAQLEKLQCLDLRKTGVKVPIVLISGQANIEMAVKATKLGALDFLEKPLSTEKLLVTVENALRLSRLEEENRELRHRLGKHELVGSGPAMKKLIAFPDTNVKNAFAAAVEKIAAAKPSATPTDEAKVLAKLRADIQETVAEFRGKATR